MKFVRVLAIISYLLIAGCAATKSSPSIREVMNSWKGSHISLIIRQWVAYSQVVDDGAGGEIYIWITRQRAGAPVTVYNPPVQRAQQPETQPTIRVPRRTTTRGTMRWNPVLQQYEWEEETTPSAGLRIPDISGSLKKIRANEDTPSGGAVLQRVLREQMARRAGQPRPPQRREFFVRPDGTIYHWRISGY